MPDDNGTKEISVETPIGKLAAKGVRISDLIAIVTAVGVGFLSYVWAEHKMQTKEATGAVAASIKESAKAQRLMTCIISLPQERREQEFTQPNSFCQRMSNLP